MTLSALAVSGLLLLFICCSMGQSGEVIKVALVQGTGEMVGPERAAGLAVNRSKQEGGRPLFLPNHPLELDTIQVNVSLKLQSTQTGIYCKMCILYVCCWESEYTCMLCIQLCLKPDTCSTGQQVGLEQYKLCTNVASIWYTLYIRMCIRICIDEMLIRI